MMAVYSIGELVRRLGLKTETQVRNRIEAIRDLLEPHLHRGPNNRILVDENGLELLRALQLLCESGKTVKEAAKTMRDLAARGKGAAAPQDDDAAPPALIRHLEEEIRFLRRLLLEGKREDRPWWEKWRWL